jgi:hypothetical protein
LEKLRIHSVGGGALENEVPLVFFYKGSTLPAYASVSLARARASWKGPVLLLHDQDVHPRVEGVDCEQFSSWYDPGKFEQFKKTSALDEAFRSGFWFHATERLFVLDQWSVSHKVDRFAHAELDVDVRCSQTIALKLDSWGTGLFYPFGTHEHAGASFLYSNSPVVLSSLVEELSAGVHAGDEMHALWDFGIAHPELVHVLPSHTVFEEGHPETTGLSFVPPEHVGGLFDVQPFGTWILGQDPRNSPLEPHFNHFLFEEIGPSSLGHLRFFLDPFRNRLWVKSRESERHEVLAFHVHSKRFTLVSHRLVLFAVVLASNLQFRLPLGLKNVVRFVSRRWKKPVDYLYLLVKKWRANKS